MPRRRTAYSHQQKRYAMVFLEETETALIRPNRLTRTELRLWVVLLTRCQWGNGMTLTQRELGQILRVHSGEVSRALTVLVAEGLILKEKQLKQRRWLYRLPTTLAQHGPLTEVVWKRSRDQSKQDAQRSGARNASSPRTPRSPSLPEPSA